MDQASIVRYITDTFDDIHVVTADDNLFFLQGTDQMMPFATLMTNDVNDRASDLSRPSIFRLNIGVSRDTYRSQLGQPPPPPPAGDGFVNTGHDFTALDQLMPHPVYGHMSWVCVLNPSEATFETVRQLLAEAHGRAARRNAKRAPSE